MSMAITAALVLFIIAFFWLPAAGLVGIGILLGAELAA